MTGSILQATAGASAATPNAIKNTGSSALTGLSNNFASFLSLLMTQLQHQDPSAPMDANQFTTQLVQFSGVEQQIGTNAKLAQLIQLGQANQVEQSAAILGKPVTAASTQLTLQKGVSDINFNTVTAEPVAIAVYNSAGAQIKSDTVTTVAGANKWAWNGKAANGTTMPDGAYKVTVTALGVPAGKADIPFTVTGTATSVQNNSGTVQVQMGGLTLPFTAVQSVGGG